jgi:hypothetical protein
MLLSTLFRLCLYCDHVCNSVSFFELNQLCESIFACPFPILSAGDLDIVMTWLESYLPVAFAASLVAPVVILFIQILL